MNEFLEAYLEAIDQLELEEHQMDQIDEIMESDDSDRNKWIKINNALDSII